MVIKRLILIIFSLCLSVNAYAVAPTLVDYQQSDFTDNVSTETTGSITWQAADYIICLGATEDVGTLMSVPVRTGLTFTQRALASFASNTTDYLWDATAVGSGSGTVVSNITVGGTPTAQAAGLSCFVYRGSDGLGATNTMVTNTTTSVISLVRANANSAVAIIFGDWNAINDTTVTASPVSGGTQRVAQFITSKASFFVFSWTDQGAAATSNFGFTNHSGGAKFAGVAVEIKGTAGGGGGSTCKSGLTLLGAGCGN